MTLNPSTLALALLFTLGASNATSASSSPAGTPPAVASRLGHGVGVVRAIDLPGGSVTLQHGPIVALGWPGMTMPFKVKPAAELKALKVGQTVDFTVQDADVGPLIIAIHAR